MDDTSSELRTVLQGPAQSESPTVFIGTDQPEHTAGLDPANGKRHPSIFAFGRRGGPLKPGTKTPSWMHVTRRYAPARPRCADHKINDGRTHLAHKAEHAVDLETGAVLAVTLQPATAGDTNTLHETLTHC